MIMLTLANPQKELRAIRLLAAPKANARELVRDVIVMAGPACLKASVILSLADLVYSI